MKMKMVSLQSGSNGNCIYVESDGVRLLFDAGISGKQTKERLAQIGVDVASIHAVVISHDHADHISEAGVLHREFGLPIWATQKTYEQATKKSRLGKIANVSFFKANETLTFKKLRVETISTTHDGIDGVGFVVDNGSLRLGILTDLGEVTAALSAAVKTLDGVLLESNYDQQMLIASTYADFLKRRIQGCGGHLSNVEAANLLCCGTKLRWACLGHLSQNCNHPDLVLETHRQILGPKLNLLIASRHDRSDVLEL